MANEGTIRIHRLIGGAGAAFRVSFVPYDSDGEGTAGVRSFHEVQQVRTFLKSIGVNAEVIKEALRQLAAGRSASVPNVALVGRSREEFGLGRYRNSGKALRRRLAPPFGAARFCVVQRFWNDELKEQHAMAYSDKVVEHYNNPRNVGSLPKEDPNVGTGLVGAPECGDVMKLQMKINPDTKVIEEAKFKTFGCGSAIASSSLATEWVKGKTVEEALNIKNTDIVRELSLPPVKIHCSVLAEDAIKAAIGDWKKKHGIEVPVAEKAAH